MHLYFFYEPRLAYFSKLIQKVPPGKSITNERGPQKSGTIRPDEQRETSRAYAVFGSAL